MDLGRTGWTKGSVHRAGSKVEAVCAKGIRDSNSRTPYFPNDVDRSLIGPQNMVASLDLQNPTVRAFPRLLTDGGCTARVFPTASTLRADTGMTSASSIPTAVAILGP
jgi:hypothetical protein